MATTELDPYKIIEKPIVTEKSTRLAHMENQYTFKVMKKASKVQIKQAIAEIFDVEVAKVRTMNYRGKPRRIRYKTGRRPDWKKAVVTLEEGYHIDII